MYLSKFDQIWRHLSLDVCAQCSAFGVAIYWQNMVPYISGCAQCPMFGAAIYWQNMTLTFCVFQVTQDSTLYLWLCSVLLV